MAKISIIIPVYNTEKYLPQCLDSVCNQTLSDIEIICINDCSEDNSLSILNEYAKKDKRIKVIDFKEKKSVGYARNFAMEMVQSEYIGFIDSDDFIDLDFYEKLYSKAEKTNADLVKGELKNYDTFSKKTTIPFFEASDMIKRHKAYFYSFFTTAIYKTSLIKENNLKFLEDIILGEDPYFMIEVGLYYKTIEIVKNTFYYYRNNMNSLTRKQKDMLHAKSIVVSGEETMKLINTHDIDKEHYAIIFSYIFDSYYGWCSRSDITNQMITMAAESFFKVWESCKYKEYCLIYYFLSKKEKARLDQIKKINILRERVKANRHA